MTLHRNAAGDEFVNFLRRNRLHHTDPAYRFERNPRRSVVPAPHALLDPSTA